MACCGCKCCANPGYEMFNRWTTLLLSLVAWILSVVTLASCDYVTSDFGDFGLFSARLPGLTQGCTSYDDTEDGAHVAAQAGGVTSSVCLGLNVIGQLVMILVLQEKAAKIVWNFCRAFFVVALIGNMMVPAFLYTVHDYCVDTSLDNFLNDDEDEGGFSWNAFVDCDLGAAARVSGVNWFIIIVLMILMCCVPIPHEPLFFKQGCGSCTDNGVYKQDAYKDPTFNPENNEATEAGSSYPGEGTKTTTTYYDNQE